MIYSPREKLQKLRKQYKISQLELVGDKISRSHLAMIETGKTKLSKRVAQSLIENFNEILVNKGINDIITLDYLIEDINTQILRKRANYIEVLNRGSLNDDLIYEIEDFIKVADIESKVVLYSKIGDFYFSSGDLKRAFGYYSRTFDEALIVNDYKILGNLVLKLSTINYKNKDYINNSLLEKNTADKLVKFHSNRKEVVLNNFVKSFMHIGDYDKAIYYIEILLKEATDSDKKFKLELTKGKLLEKKEAYPIVISIYRGMLLKYKEEEKKFVVCIKLMSTYKLMGESDKVEAYYKKNIITLKKIQTAMNFEENQALNFELGVISLYLEKYDKAMEFFKNVIESRVDFNTKIMSETLYHIIKLSEKNDYEFIKKVENIYFDNKIEKDMCKVGYLFLNYYKEYQYFSDEIKFLNRVISLI